MKKEKDDLQNQLKSKEDELTKLQLQLHMKENDLQHLKNQLNEAVKQKSVSEINHPFFIFISFSKVHII